MTTLNKYRIYCITESNYVTTWAETKPTTCPNNTSHTIDNTKTSIVDTQTDNLITIKEENTPTGGHFSTTTLVIEAIANTVTSASISWPFQIGALSLEFETTSDHTDDVINMCIGQDTIIGAIVANVSPATAWTSENYTVGQAVTNNGKVYTCTTNTVSNESPPNLTYWTEGLEVSVSPTVITYTRIGFYMKLFNGVNNDDVGRVLSIDTTNNKIYVETNAVNSFLASSPTYVRQSVYCIDNMVIGFAGRKHIGNSKIGSSCIPKDINVTVSYDNKHPTLNKKIYGRVEFLY